MSDHTSLRARLASRLAEPPPAHRILVVRLGAAGDVVRTRFAFPGLRSLYPRATIDWLVEDRAASALEGIVGLDGVVRVPRRELAGRPRVAMLRTLRDLRAELRARRYDLAVDFHGILKSAALVYASGTPIRVGYGPGFAREGAWLLYNHRVRVSPTHLGRFERNAALVRYLGGEAPDAAPELEIPTEAERRIDAAGLPPDPVVLHPGTSASTLYKRWSATRYAEVARRLGEGRGWPCVVTWGPVEGELECAQEVVAAAGGRALLGPRTEGLSDLLALLRRARLFIGSDSAPMHLAALAGRPLVVIYGPTDPVENFPFSGVPVRTVRHDVGCNPCRAGCPVRVCMESVTVEEVVEAAGSVVAGA
jgi:ADP-heptose:LPS heptosyltransferase